MSPGLIGGLVGSVIGLAGGLVGTWASIRNTRSPRERAFVVRFAIAIGIGITIFLVAMLLIPRPYNMLLWIPYAVALPLGIIAANRRQSEFVWIPRSKFASSGRLR
jgi:uncharacterized membrane protein required for colicin V production